MTDDDADFRAWKAKRTPSDEPRTNVISDVAGQFLKNTLTLGPELVEVSSRALSRGADMVGARTVSRKLANVADTVQARKEMIEETVGDPESTTATVADVGSRIATRALPFMAGGVPGGIAATATYAAAAPEYSQTKTVAELLKMKTEAGDESMRRRAGELLDKVAATTGGRIAGDLVIDFTTGQILRGAGKAASRGTRAIGERVSRALDVSEGMTEAGAQGLREGVQPPSVRAPTDDELYDAVLQTMAKRQAANPPAPRTYRVESSGPPAGPGWWRENVPDQTVPVERRLSPPRQPVPTPGNAPVGPAIPMGGPTEGSLAPSNQFKEARRASGGLRNLDRVDDDALFRELADRTEALNRDTIMSEYRDVPSESGGVYMRTVATRTKRGTSQQAEAMHRAKVNSATIDKIDAELKRRGLADDDIFEGMRSAELAKKPLERMSEADIERSGMFDAERLAQRYEPSEVAPGVFFSNPVGPAARYVGTSPIASAAVGAGVGALSDDEHRVRNALIGAGLGYGAGRIGQRLVQTGAPRPAYLADPDIARVAGTIATGERAATKPMHLLSPVEKQYVNLVDELYPLRKLGKTVGGSEELSDVATQGLRWRGMAKQKLVEDLKPILRDIGEHAEGVMSLVKAQRAIVLLDQGLEKTDIPLETLVASAKKLSAIPEVVEGATALQGYYRSLLDLRHANGVIDDAGYQAIVESGDFYTPFVREFEEGAGKPQGAGGGKWFNRGTGVRKMDAKKARAKTVDPFEQAVQDTQDTYRAIAKQRVTNVVAKIVEENPEGTFPFLRRVSSRDAAKSGNVVEANVQGRRQTFEVVDKDLHDAWAAFDPPTQSVFVKVMQPLKRSLQTTVTLLPDFAVANAMRDNVMTGIQYGMSGKSQAIGTALGAVAGATLADEGQRTKGALIGGGIGLGAGSIAPNIARTLGAMRSVIKNDDLYQQFLRDGGGMDGFYVHTPADARKVLKELQQSGVPVTDIVSPAKAMQFLGNAITHPLKSLKAVGNVIEQAPRVARHAATTGSAARQVAQSADISLDFLKHGKHTKGIAATTAFWNPKVQGWDKLGRMLKNPKTLAAGAATITAPSIALWAINKDNPEYWERPQWERNLFWLVPKSEGGFYRVPKPFEVGYIFASIPERMLDYAYQHDPETLKFALRDMASTSSEGTFPIPTGLEPLAENYVNYDFFRNRPVVARPDLPDEMQSDERTSSLALGVGKVTGTSPQQIDNMIQGYTGGAGRLATSAIDRMARSTGLDTRPLAPDASMNPFRRFVTKEGATSDAEQAIYRRADEAEKIHRGLTELEKRGDPVALERFIDQHLDRLADGEVYREAAKQLKELRAERKAVLTNRELSAADRKEMMDVIDELLRETAQALVAP